MDSGSASPSHRDPSHSQRRAHRAVRRQHRDERAEDYVETIYRIESEDQTVRVVDLQQRFGVSHVTVIRALAKLAEEGLVDRTDDGISLTPAGTDLARSCYERHATVEAFLLALGISPETAARDAEGIEHHLSDESLAALRGFVRHRLSDSV